MCVIHLTVWCIQPLANATILEISVAVKLLLPTKMVDLQKYWTGWFIVLIFLLYLTQNLDVFQKGNVVQLLYC